METLQKYNISPNPAAGSYGLVFFATRKSDGRDVAMKFFGYTQMQPHVSWILREIDNMRALTGVRGVVQIVETFLDTAEGYVSNHCKKYFKFRYPVIVMARLDGGELFHKIVELKGRGEKFSEWDVAYLFREFMITLNEIHNVCNMINLDLKTENIVCIGSELKSGIKIIDFGMAVSLWDRQEHCQQLLVGTPAFMAPETLINYRHRKEAMYSRASDMWQAGCILYILLMAQLPFGLERQGLEERIVAGHITSIDPSLSPLAKDLLSRLFVLDPARRYTSAQTLEHPWLRDRAQLPTVDLGSEYDARLRNWSCLRAFRRLLTGGELVNLSRRLALQQVLDQAGNISFEGTHMYVPYDPARSFAPPDSVHSGFCSQKRNRVNIDDSTALGIHSNYGKHNYPCSVDGDGRDTPRTLAVTQQVASLTLVPPSFSPPSVPSPPTEIGPFQLTRPQSLNQSLRRSSKTLVIDKAAIDRLKSAFVDSVTPRQYVEQKSLPSRLHIPMHNMSNVNPPPAITAPVSVATMFGPSPTIPLIVPTFAAPSFVRTPSRIAAENALRHAGMDYRSFATVMRRAGLEQLSGPEVFAIFDWNGDGSVEYLEFLLTLSSFRTDVDWAKPDSVARIYYDAFDVDGQQKIGVDILALVIGKLLGDGPGGGSSSVSKLAGATAADSETAALVRAIDADRSGTVEFDEFSRFFDAVLNLQISAATADNSHNQI